MKRREIVKKAGGFLHDFKEFAMRGNVFDLAVGVIIGGAFGKITSSLVSDIIMPLIGLLIGGLNFKEWKYSLPSLWGDSPPATLNVGLFVQTLVDFTIIAFSVYLFVRLAMKLRGSPAPEPEPPPEPSEEVLLLREIRDLLQTKEN